MSMTEQQAIEAISDYKNRTKKTQSEIARELGISAGLLSDFLSGNYKAPHTVIPKIEQLLSVQAKKEVAPKEPPFSKTNVSEIVMNTISYCHIRGKIGVVYGDPGIGKTMAIREYLKNNQLAIGISISPSYSSMSGVNELIADALGVRQRVARKIYAEIVAKLKNSGRVIIIDEAQHLTVRTLDHLRCMADESGVGLCLVGNDAVYSKLTGTGQADFAQLFSRIGMHKQVLTNNISKEDVKQVFGDELDDEALELLFRISRTHYGLRGAVNVFVNTAAVFKMVEAAGIARMAKEMNIG